MTVSCTAHPGQRQGHGQGQLPALLLPAKEGVCSAGAGAGAWAAMAQAVKISAHAPGSAAPPTPGWRGGGGGGGGAGFGRWMRSPISMSLSSQGTVESRAHPVTAPWPGGASGLAGDAGQCLFCGQLGPGWPFWGREGLSCTEKVKPLNSRYF